jgi:hypothetical protein
MVVRMRRWILFCVVFAVAIGAGFAGYLFVYRAEFLSLAITKAIDTPVYIKRVDFSMNGLTLQGLRIENPAGNTVKNALTVNKLKVKINVIDLLKELTGIGGDKIVIDEIKIDKPKMNVELYSLGSSDNNWKKIVERSSHKHPSEEKTSRRFFIKKFLITNLQLEVKYAIVPEGSLRPSPIAKIELKNIGKDSPLSTQEVLKVVFQELLRRASTDLKLELPKE